MQNIIKDIKRISNLIGFFVLLQLNEYFFRTLGNSGNEPRRRSECRVLNDHIEENEGMLRQLSKDIKPHTEENRIMGDAHFQKAVDFKEQEIEMISDNDQNKHLEKRENNNQNREANIRRNVIASNPHNESYLHRPSAPLE